MFNLRFKKLKKILIINNLDSLLVSNFFNILYLTGFKTLTKTEREAWLLITKKNVYLFTDSRYINNNKVVSSPIIKKLITLNNGLLRYLKEIINNEGIKNFGVEGDDIKINEFNKLSVFLDKTKIIPTQKLILNLRSIKDFNEVQNIKKACKVSDRCLTELIPLIKVGVSEKEIAFKIERWLKEKDFDLAFYPIIAIDKNSSIPHYDTRTGNNTRIKDRSIILIDFGIIYSNYVSDMTRVVFFKKPKQEIINYYNKLQLAQEETIQNLSYPRSWVRYEEVDNFCRKQLLDQGIPLNNIYSHSTGHGVGLEIHEHPKISKISENLIRENQIITIEPGIYKQNRWGLRIEDTVLIKNNGCETLTRFSKEPSII